MLTPAQEASEFLSLVKGLKPGSKITYHRGNLAFDRENNPSLSAKASKMYKAWTGGLVHLVQRRVEGGFEYIGVRR